MEERDDPYLALRARCVTEGIQLLGWENHLIWKNGVVYLLRATFPDGKTRTALGLSPETAARCLEDSFSNPESFQEV